MNDQVATPTGAPADDSAAAPPEQPVNPRDAILNAMDEQIHGERIADQQAFVAEHAEELGLQPTVDSQQPDGAAAVEPMHPPAEPPAPAPLPDGLDQSPYADYIVMHEGAPHMKAKVHGVDKLIPMERVQAQAQKLEAAEVSMQNAATLQRELRQREEWIRQNETALQSRMDALATTPPPAPGVDDETLVTESREIVKTLFSGDEDEAAQKLAGLMKQTRAPVATAPAIDVTQIATQAAGIAVGQMTEAEIKRDATAGLAQFQQDYPELMADPVLYNIADNMTDVVENEHPDWKPSAIMLEAGKRTRDWLAQQKGQTPPGDPPPQPPAGDDPNRQERKDNLVRIPQPALGAVSPHGETEEPVQTPADALAEIREARGQPV